MALLKHRYYPLLSLGLLLLPVMGCKEADNLLGKYNKIKEYGSSDFKQVAGDELSSSLATGVGSLKTNISDVLKAIQIEQDATQAAGLNLTEGEAISPIEVEASVSSFLTNVQQSKIGLISGDFLKISGDELALTPEGEPEPKNALGLVKLDDKVEWSAPEDKYTISTLDKMPVRNQGQRGTCASFAGMGQLEGFLIKKYGLESLNLSEQRFYFMSKPKHWQNGGPVNSGGSNTGTGYAKSNGIEYKGVSFPPGSPESFNIPLESKCAYNKNLGANDVQIPQTKGCLTGVAKVESFAAWIHDHERRPTSAQEIYDILVNEDIPVVVATKLSSNWEDNDGMITLAEAGVPGDSSHASGHAYLLVGAQKIDESKFPGEGGMCFIVKNSWGKGWGVGGYSCMTLAWFNQWRYESGFARVFDATLDPEQVSEAAAYVKQKPTNLIEADTNIKKREISPVKVSKRGRVSFLVEGDKAIPPREIPVSEMQAVQLRTDGDEFVRGFYKVENNWFSFKGLRPDERALTQQLSLPESGGVIFLEDELLSKRQVGSIDAANQTVELCSGAFSGVCDIRFDDESQELVIGFSEQESQRITPEGPFDWQSFAVGGYGIEFSSSELLNGSIDVRFQVAGIGTNPLRFQVDPITSNILYLGNAIGNFKDFQMCSGAFADVCRVIVSEKNFNVLYRSKRKEL